MDKARRNGFALASSHQQSQTSNPINGITDPQKQQQPTEPPRKTGPDLDRD